MDVEGFVAKAVGSGWRCDAEGDYPESNAGDMFLKNQK